MITIPFVALAVILLVIAATFFVIGWESAVHSYREARNRLVTSIDQLEIEVSKLNHRLEEEPLRAAMSHGQLYILNQFEALLTRLRESIP